MAKYSNIAKYGGRGSGRPKDKIQYGKRVCMLVETYPTYHDAWRKRQIFESEGIMAIVRKWYSKWCVYKCGARMRTKSKDVR